MNSSASKGLFAALRRPAWRLGDANAATRVRDCRRGQLGLTLFEMLVTTAVFAVVVATAASRMPRNGYALMGAHEQLLADLRQTRADALTKGDHFRIDVTTSKTYAEYRLKLVGTVWTVSGSAVRSRTLPSNLSFNTGTGSQFEFNTRGLLILPGQAASLQLKDSYTGKTKTVTVWPSGQVAPS